MSVVSISRDLTKENDLISVPRVQYAEFLAWREVFTKKARTPKNDKDTDLAVKIYRQEKKNGKLRAIKSLADLD